jgi:hypothetical protein
MMMASSRTVATASLHGAASMLAAGWSALALVASLWPGLGAADPDAHLPAGFAGDRPGFVLAALLPLVAVLQAAALFARRDQGERLEPIAAAADRSEVSERPSATTRFS